MADAAEFQRLRRELLSIAQRVEAALREQRGPLDTAPVLPGSSSATVRTFARNLRAARQNAGLTQRVVAARAGLSLSYVSVLERAAGPRSSIRSSPWRTVLGIAPARLLEGMEARAKVTRRS